MAILVHSFPGSASIEQGPGLFDWLAMGDLVGYKFIMDLSKARSSVAAARLCLAHGHPDSAASRAYYGMFQAAQVALGHVGFHRTGWSHGGLQAAFANELTRRRKLLPGRLVRHLIESLGLRTAADYSEVDVRVKHATQAVIWAEEFLARVEEMVRNG